MTLDLTWLSSAMPAILAVINWIIRISMLLIVPRGRSPAAAQAWLLLIFFLPIVGLILFMLLGRHKLTARRMRFQLRFDGFVSEVWSQLRNTSETSGWLRERLPAESVQPARLATNLTKLPPFDGNRVELLPMYDESIARIVATIDEAKHAVHVAFYIFADDATGQAFADTLIRAAQRGVVVRLLVDSVGSRQWSKNLPALLERLRAGGVEAHEALPVRWNPFHRNFTRPDLRNHRKIVVVDNQVAFAGSQNMIRAEFKPGIIYEEMVVRVDGPAALQLQATFMADWYAETGMLIRSETNPEVAHLPTSSGAALVQVLPSGPSFPTESNLHVFVELLYTAQRRAVLTTPYCIPNSALLLAMKSAAARGVDVELIVSGVADQFLAPQAQRSYYEELLSAGIGVRLYNPPRLLHAKVMRIDDTICTVGSSNLDIRSFQLDLEVTLLIYDREVNQELGAIERHYFEHSKPIALDEWQRRPLRQQFLQNTARLVSALL